MTNPNQDPTLRYALVRPRLSKELLELHKDAAPEDAARAALRKEAEIDPHLQFVHDLCKKHDVQRKNNSAIYTALEQIRERENERRLFMGVLGEFSSGKSTLINALLRDDLLRTNILQGTTAAATLLSYSPTLRVDIRPLQGNLVIDWARAWLFPTALLVGRYIMLLLRFYIALCLRGYAALKGSEYQPPPVVHQPPLSPREQLRERIHQASADEQIARNVLQVEVGHPATILRQGMVIVDLPGTNAENPRHGQVTAAALRDLCDAAIIVVPADAPGSESLWNFLQHHLEADVLRRCVFVLNKIDRIRKPRDRDMLLHNIRIRLTNDLGIAQPRVLVAAPGRLMETLPDAVQEEGDVPLTAAEREKWTNEFVQAENQLWQFLQESKLLLQVERLVRLLTRIFAELARTLQEHEERYRKQHEALVANTIPHLAEFMKQAQAKHASAYQVQRVPIVERGGTKVVASWNASVRQLSEVIFSTKSKTELRQAVESKLPAALTSAERDLQKALRAITNDLEKAADREHREFFDQFQEHYRRLATLGGRVQSHDSSHEIRATRQFRGELSEKQNEVAAAVKTQLNQEFGNKAGGAIGGAVLGSMVLPGVGTIIGGILGGVWGSLFGPSLAQLQSDCWSKLAPALDANFASFAATAEEGIEHVADEIGNNLTQRIAAYHAQYAQLVRDMEARDRDQAKQLEQRRQVVARDREQVRLRLDRLQAVRERLRNQ